MVPRRGAGRRAAAERPLRRVVPAELRNVALGAEAPLGEPAIGGTAGAGFRVAMTVRPWGIEVNGPRPWPAIAAVSHRTVADRDVSEREQVPWSVLRVSIEDAVYVGACLHEPNLEVLDAMQPLYGADAGTLVALGLGAPSSTISPSDPRAFEALLAAARAFLSSSEGRALAPPKTADYRSASRVVSAEATRTLVAALGDSPGAQDRGPFAAIVAAELGVGAAVGQLLALTLSPSPLLAAVARGAAQKLGVHPSRTFPVHDVAPFLDRATLERIEAWAQAHLGQR